MLTITPTAATTITPPSDHSTEPPTTSSAPDSRTRPLSPGLVSTAEPASARVVRSAAGPYRQATAPASSSPAVRKRAPADRNGGMVSTTTRMPRYVEP
ncbi:hypothetical protein AB0P12_12080 [Streptomyces subrutilus]|uniref:hypothetical protein n=1 Tax=Streptomyces subrutilus TaxID=36818 RepID=UPI002E13642A|nr:hypothetical protein OG479_22540 [Streptomyces subrutilus]